MVSELEKGPMTPCEARDKRMYGGYVPLGLYLDAKSVFAAVTATFIKPPAEKSLLCHIQYIRELLDKRVLQYLFWIDTRDMTSDGLTKGSVGRDLLHLLMEGIQGFKHEHEHWQCKTNSRNQQLLEETAEHTPTTHVSLFAYTRPQCSERSGSVPEYDQFPPERFPPGTARAFAAMPSAASHSKSTLADMMQAEEYHGAGELATGGGHRADASGSGSRPPASIRGSMVFSLKETYVYEGKTYPKKQSKEVRTNKSIEEVQEYVKQVATMNSAVTGQQNEGVPYNNVHDFVVTLQAACNSPGSKFTFPNDAVNYVHTLTHALATLPPGFAVNIKNGTPPPDHMLEKFKETYSDSPGPGGHRAYGPGPIQSEEIPLEEQPGNDNKPIGHATTHYHAAEKYKFDPSKDPSFLVDRSAYREYYHGIDPFNVIAAVTDGLRPSLGAGCQDLTRHYGVPVPGVYVAPTLEGAAMYPINSTTGVVAAPHRAKPNEYSGGSLLALGGMFPVRCILRVIGSPNKQLWARGSSQHLFMPHDLYIANIIIYSVHPSLVHEYHLKYEPVHSETVLHLENHEIEGDPAAKPRLAWDGQMRGGYNMTKGKGLAPPRYNPALESIITHPDFKPTSHALANVALATAVSEQTKYPMTATAMKRVAVLSPEDLASHPKRQVENYIRKDIFEQVYEEYPHKVCIGVIQGLEPHAIADLIGVSAEEVTRSQITGPIAIYMPRLRGDKVRDRYRSANPFLFPPTNTRAIFTAMRSIMDQDGLPQMRRKGQQHNDAVVSGVHTADVRDNEFTAGVPSSSGGHRADALAAPVDAADEPMDTVVKETKSNRRRAAKTARLDDPIVQEKTFTDHVNNKRGPWSQCLRTSHSMFCRIALGEEYHGKYLGMWSPPARNIHLMPDHAFILKSDVGPLSPDAIEAQEYHAWHLEGFKLHLCNRTEKDITDALHVTLQTVDTRKKKDVADRTSLVLANGVSVTKNFLGGLPCTELVCPEMAQTRVFLQAFGVFDAHGREWARIPGSQEFEANNADGNVFLVNIHWKRFLETMFMSPHHANFGNYRDFDPYMYLDHWLDTVVKSAIRREDSPAKPNVQPYGILNDFFFKQLSHFGGHIMDYCWTELSARAGHPTTGKNGYRVVNNWTYVEIYNDFRDQFQEKYEKFRRVGGGNLADTIRFELFDKYLSLSNRQGFDPLGDVFEQAVADLVYHHDMIGFWQLLGLIFIQERKWALMNSRPGQEMEHCEAIARLELQNAKEYNSVRGQTGIGVPAELTSWGPVPEDIMKGNAPPVDENLRAEVMQTKDDTLIITNIDKGTREHSPEEEVPVEKTAVLQRGMSLVLQGTNLGAPQVMQQVNDNLHIPHMIIHQAYDQLDTFRGQYYASDSGGRDPPRQKRVTFVDAEEPPTIRPELLQAALPPKPILKRPSTILTAGARKKSRDDSSSEEVATIKPIASSSEEQQKFLSKEVCVPADREETGDPADVEMADPVGGHRADHGDKPAPYRTPVLTPGWGVAHKSAKPLQQIETELKIKQDQVAQQINNCRDTINIDTIIDMLDLSQPNGWAALPIEYQTQQVLHCFFQRRQERHHVPAPPYFQKPLGTSRYRVVDQAFFDQLTGRSELNDVHRTQMSRRLSHILRHVQKDFRNFEIRPDGFANAFQVLAELNFGFRPTLRDLFEVVRLNDKQRFEMKQLDAGPGTNDWFIKAAQGHSIPEIDPDQCYKRITEHPDGTNVCIHGTQYRNLRSIWKHGLLVGGLPDHHKGRNMLHTIPFLPKDKRIVSGLRHNSEVLLWLDFDELLKDGIRFYQSVNNVMMTPGDKHGNIPTKYIHKVTDTKTGKNVRIDDQGRADPSDFMPSPVTYLRASANSRAAGSSSDRPPWRSYDRRGRR